MLCCFQSVDEMTDNKEDDDFNSSNQVKIPSPEPTKEPDHNDKECEELPDSESSAKNEGDDNPLHTSKKSTPDKKDTVEEMEVCKESDNDVSVTSPQLPSPEPQAPSPKLLVEKSASPCPPTPRERSPEPTSADSLVSYYFVLKQ